MSSLSLREIKLLPRGMIEIPHVFVDFLSRELSEVEVELNREYLNVCIA